jgi:hypothetical protein
MNKSHFTKTLPLIFAFALGGFGAQVIAPSMQAYAQIPVPLPADPTDVAFEAYKQQTITKYKYQSAVFIVIDPTKTPQQIQAVLDYYVLAGFSVKGDITYKGLPCIIMTK